MPADPSITLAQMVRPGSQQAQQFFDLQRRVSQLEREEYLEAAARQVIAPLNPATATAKECAEVINKILAMLVNG